MVIREVFVCFVSWLAVLGWIGAEAVQTPALNSPEVSGCIARLAGGLMQSSSEQDRAAAMFFCQAAILLDETNPYLYEQFLVGLPRGTNDPDEYAATTQAALKKYISKSADIEIIFGAMEGLYRSLDSRPQREAFLKNVIAEHSLACPTLASEAALQFGLLQVEKADYIEAMRNYELAVQLNPYNLTAVEKLLELSASNSETQRLGDAMRYARTRLVVNPMDAEAAMMFADAALAGGLYDVAAAGYEYASRLSTFHGGDGMDDRIALGWAQSCYLTPRMESQCIMIAQQFRQTGKLNLELESLAAMAARKIGKHQDASQILLDAETKALKSMQSAVPNILPEQLGWFYCFAAVSPEKALAWCDKAFAARQTDPAVRALTAYAFFLNDQVELAEQYASDSPSDAIGQLTMARVAIGKDQKQKAIELLKSVLTSNPPLPIAVLSQELLQECGSQFIAAVSPETLRNASGQVGAMSYTAPNKLFFVKLSMGSEELSFAGDMDGKLIIQNMGQSPLVIQEGGLLGGQIRVDAVVRGDINAEMPRLLEKKIRPASPVLPGQYAAVGLDFNTTSLSRLLFQSPQASVEVEFKVYMDPVETEDGHVSNALGVEPVKTVIRRKGMVLNREFVLQKLDVLDKGQQGQRLRSAELFLGLLAEQKAAQIRPLPYRYIQVEPSLLVDSVRKCLTDSNWVVQSSVLCLLAQNQVPLDYAMTTTISGNLSSEYWPVRMLSIWLLNNHQKDSFRPVLNWTAQYDNYWLNRQFAILLGADASTEKTGDPNQPEKSPAEK